MQMDKNKEILLWRAEVIRMYKLFDDMSTAGDMYKPEHTNYVKHVGKLVEDGLNNGIITSDGYNLYRKE
ncbi:MAG: hypothetical protein DRQ35_01730 [Gammaproteobacteria bacterium]|nr:MAG: hypothetical protein DRQ35_01730 [Gammaproteobacteria bacterium]